MPDPVFASLTLGEGIALDPLGECLHAPCDGGTKRRPASGTS
ncbi:hypothetical protein [Halomonas sp. 3D7M]